MLVGGGVLDARVIALPKCGRHGCECQDQPDIWLLWVSVHEQDRWLCVGDAPAGEERLYDDEWPDLALALYPRVCEIAGVPWGQITPGQVGRLATAHQALLDQMPPEARDLLLDISLGGEYPQDLVDGMRMFVQVEASVLPIVIPPHSSMN